MERTEWHRWFSSLRLVALPLLFLLPISVAFAHGPDGSHTSHTSWMVALSPHAALMLVLGVFAGMLAAYLRRAVWARVGLVTVAIALPLTSFTQIAVIPVPHTFADGEPATASEVNQNFQAVVQQIANHANNEQLHGGDAGITSVDGLLGGTISGTVTLEGGTLFADSIGVKQVALVDDNGDAQLLLSLFPGGASMDMVGTSAAISFSSDGDTRLDGKNTFVTGIEGSVVIENEISGGILLTSLEDTTVTTGGDTTITSGNLTNIQTGASTVIQTVGATVIETGGTASIDANRIELNAP